MGKGSSSSPSPDPQIGQAALKQAQTGEQWLNFARDSFDVSMERQAELDALTRQVTEAQLGIMQQQGEWAKADRDRYETTFKPIEEQFVEEATTYDSPERQAQAASEARADVLRNADMERDAASREAMSLGINPASGRYAGIQRAGELGTAVAAAGAENTARRSVRDKGLALKADVVNIGRGLPAQSAQATSLGLGAGNSAVGNAGAANQQYLSSTGIMSQGYQGAMAGYGGQANTLNNLYNSELNAWSANQQASSNSMAGLFSGLGTAAGLIWSDENVKKNKKKVKKGTALKAVNDMRVEEWDYHEGVGDGGHHIGPYAQDFAATTGLGNGRQFKAQDAIGVTMKAVQDLDDKVDEIAVAVGLGKKEAA